MTVIFFLSALPTDVTQERVRWPSIKTMQAPHRPSPQPYLELVKWRSSLRTSSRGRSGSVSTVRFWPLTIRVILASIVFLHKHVLFNKFELVNSFHDLCNLFSAVIETDIPTLIWCYFSQ